MAKVVDRYTYRVTWSEEDQEYVGLCAEFPSLSWLEDTPEKALAGIRKLVKECLNDMQANGEAVPVPIATKTFLIRYVPQPSLRTDTAAALCGRRRRPIVRSFDRARIAD